MEEIASNDDVVTVDCPGLRPEIKQGWRGYLTVASPINPLDIRQFYVLCLGRDGDEATFLVIKEGIN